MHAMLVLDRDGKWVRIVVSLRQKKIRDQVLLLLEENRCREAFEILKRKAEVKEYLPAGARPSVVPRVTLFEDML